MKEEARGAGHTYVGFRLVLQKGVLGFDLVAILIHSVQEKSREIVGAHPVRKAQVILQRAPTNLSS